MYKINIDPLGMSGCILPAKKLELRTSVGIYHHEIIIVIKHLGQTTRYIMAVNNIQGCKYQYYILL